MPEDNENASIPDDAEEDIPFPGGPSSEDVSESDGDGHKTVENTPKTMETGISAMSSEAVTATAMCFPTTAHRSA